MKKKALVVHSGGMDSSICLALAIQEFGRQEVISVSFKYGQRHAPELNQAAKICDDWKVDHIELPIDCLQEITESALMNKKIPIEHLPGQLPNTLVVGRNGLMAHLAAIHIDHLGGECIYMGVIGVDGSHSGYRDCSRAYMDSVETTLKLDLDNPRFQIRTPLVHLSKKETLELAQQLGVLDYLLKTTVTCYEGISMAGCKTCPACRLRNEGLRQFLKENPNFITPYPI